MERKNVVTLALGAAVVVLLGAVAVLVLQPNPPPVNPPPVVGDEDYKWGFLTRGTAEIAQEFAQLGVPFVRTGTIELYMPFDELDAYYRAFEFEGIELAVTPQPNFKDSTEKIIGGIRPFVQRYDGDADYDNDGKADGEKMPFVKYWQLGTEVDASATGIEKATPQRYAEVLKEFYIMVKEESPRAKVVGPSVIGHMNFPNDQGRDSKDYIKQVIDAGGLAYTDMIDFHYYYWWDALNYDDIKYSVDFLRANAKGKEIMLGETGAPSGTVEYEFDGTITKRFYSEESQAAYLAKIFPYSFALGIDKVVWAYGMVESKWGTETAGGVLMQGLGGQKSAQQSVLSDFKLDLDLGSATLTWQNPEEEDISGVMMRYSTSAYPQTVKDGTLLAEVAVQPGEVSAYVFNGAKSAVKYYYSLFPKYADGSYGAPSENFGRYVDHYFAHTGLIYNGYGSDDKGAGVKKRSYYAYKLMSEKLGQCKLGTAKIVQTGVPNTIVVSIGKKNGKMLYVAWSDTAPASNGGGSVPPVVAEGSMPPIVAQNPSVEIFVGAGNAKVTNSVPDSAGNVSSETVPARNGTLKIELGNSPVYIEPI
ncbi:MAG: hypothetical protein V1676_06060 [Candidatus Diapherotrites archaeon]